MEKQFVILYTHQKQKKAKTWHDGVLKHSGTGTKAVLYDERGCRLDSIHMKVEDIKLGEQLESDRYYILVEEVKTEVSNSQTDSVKTAGPVSVQNSTQQSYSRARCPGLKRKKSGFMPPRLVKQACSENSPSTQSNNQISTGLPTVKSSSASLFHNDTGKQVPMLPQHDISNIDVQDTECNSDKDNLFQNNLGRSRNVFNLYSQYDKLSNSSGSNKASQDSSSVLGNQKLLSPWSVYGSKNSSPSLSIGASSFKQEVGSQSPDIDKSYETKTENKCLKIVDDNIEESYIKGNRDKKQTSNKPQLVTGEIHLKEVPYKHEEDCSSMNNQVGDKSKRNISQIMNMLKKKPLPENRFETCFTNTIKDNKEQPVTNTEIRENLADVKPFSICTDKDVKVNCQKEYQQNIESENFMNAVKTDNEEQPFSGEIFFSSDKVQNVIETGNSVPDNDNVTSNKGITNLDLKEQTPNTVEMSLFGNNDEESADVDNEMMGSFNINFSPLSTVTNTDDENDCVGKENDFIDDCDSGQTDEMYDRSITLTDKVDNVDDDGCAYKNANDGSESSKVNISSVDDSNAEDKHKKQITARVNEASRKPNNAKANSGSSVKDTKGENGVEKNFEKTQDILHDMDMENNVIKQEEENQHDFITDMKTEKILQHKYPNLNENFDTNGQGTEHMTSMVKSSEALLSNECYVIKTASQDSFKPNIFKPELVNLSENVGIPLDTGKQVSDENNEVDRKVEDDNEMKQIYDDNENGTDMVVDDEVSNQVVANNASQCSRTTSASQDTMDFSCDTLDSDDSKYYGIQTQHLGRLVPSSGVSENLSCNNDKEKENHRLKNTKDSENMYCSPVLKIKSMKSLESKVEKSNTFSKDIHHHKGPFTVNNLNKVLTCQEQLDTRIPSWPGSLNKPSDTAKLTAPTSITEESESEDPLGTTYVLSAPPHPSKLIQRHGRGKANIGDTLQNRRSQDHFQLKHDTTSFDTQLGTYGTQGISSAVVSRIHLNDSVSKASSSQYQAGHDWSIESPSLSEQINQYRSPFQQLSGSDEDEIYSKLYRPRMMYHHQHSNFKYKPANTSKFSQDSSTNLFQEQDVVSQSNKCNNEELSDGGNSSLDSFPYQHEMLRRATEDNVSLNKQNCSQITDSLYSQFFESCENHLFEYNRNKVPASLESVKEDNCQEVSQDLMKQTLDCNDTLNSKWQNFVSQKSDDCDIVMNELTKTVDSARKERKEFVTLKNSRGLYNTQKSFFQSDSDAKKQESSALQSEVNGLNIQLSNNNDISELEVPNCIKDDTGSFVTKFDHIPNKNFNKIQTVDKMSLDKAQTNNSKFNLVDKDKETQYEFDSEVFSPMDSIADDDFYMEHFKESAKRYIAEDNVGEQEVPDIVSGNEKLNCGWQACDSADAIKEEEIKTGNMVNAEVADHPGSNITNIYVSERDVAAVDSSQVSNELGEQLNCKQNDLENENLDEEKHDVPESIEKIKSLMPCGSEKKIFSGDLIVKGEHSDSQDAYDNDVKEDNINKNTSIRNNSEKEETIGHSSGFSLDESLDLSFSLNNSTSTQPDRHISKIPTMRIGWKPPLKSGDQKSPNQFRNQSDSVDQPSDSKNSEKLRPTFKCLRLITQNKAAIITEKKTDVCKETMDKMTEVSCNFLNQSPDKVNDVKEKSELVQNGLSTVRNIIVDETEVTSCVQKKRQPLSSMNNLSNKSFKPPAMLRTPVVNTKSWSPHLPARSVVNRKTLSTCHPATSQQGLGVSQTEMRFPGRLETERLQTVLRQVVIPDTFSTVASYKQVLTAALTEYINTQLLDVAKRYHHALSKVDTTGFSEYKSKNSSGAVNNPNPQCQCGVPSKMICVKKEGPNCGRYFYTCSANRNQQCKFFQWADEMRKGSGMSGNKRKIQDSQSLRLYMKDQHVHFYGECQLIKRTKENINRYFKAPKWAHNRGDGDMVQKKQIFLKLPFKGRSSLYAKDDIWVISKHLDFEPVHSFLARSTYYGPSSSLEVEIEPLALYSPSNWPHEVVCHAILVGNLSSELSCMDNIRDHIQAQSPPVLSHLLNRQIADTAESVKNTSRGFQAPRIVGDHVNSSRRNLFVCSEQMDDLCRQYIDRYNLNRDQAEAMRRVANMFSVEKSGVVDSVLLIHGVFGAGKSFLLSVMVLFLVEVFHLNDSLTNGQPFPWKLLISSTTNVAVDRILMGLLDLGFEDFVRVGSVKKIAKPVLPYSVHASGTDSQELKDLQEMLRSGELTATEKSHVRQSIEKHRLGENKKKLGRVRVVGATCASCSLACLNNMEFPLVLLDECSQMTEPASLLPVARFACQKLLLVGDPKQLDPTIQGSEASHQNGLEQTMFDRLIKMGSVPTLLRTQYRCHPFISAVANNLFYGGMLEDGISEAQRKPLLEILPTICYYDVERGMECCEAAGSYYNEREAQFVVFLLQVLLSSGIEPSAVGVITLYKSQMARISDLLTGQGDCTEMKGVQVSTVDAFQGGERDVIILSTVRSHACGFIDNDKRTNVALTRARHHLLIVGNLNNLSKNVLWGKVISHCKGYENGVQSADEARHSLEKYLENLKIIDTSQNSIQSSKSNSQNSTARETLPRKRKPRRKRKLSDSDVDKSPASTFTNDQSPCRSNNSSKRHKTVVKQDTDIDCRIDNSDFDEDFIQEEIDSKLIESVECRNSSVSTHGDEQHIKENTGYCQSGKQKRKHLKHEDKLKTLSFDSDQENTDMMDVDNDDDMPTFNCKLDAN